MSSRAGPGLPHPARRRNRGLGRLMRKESEGSTESHVVSSLVRLDVVAGAARVIAARPSSDGRRSSRSPRRAGPERLRAPDLDRVAVARPPRRAALGAGDRWPGDRDHLDELLSRRRDAEARGAASTLGGDVADGGADDQTPNLTSTISPRLRRPRPSGGSHRGDARLPLPAGDEPPLLRNHLKNLSSPRRIGVTLA